MHMHMCMCDVQLDVHVHVRMCACHMHMHNMHMHMHMCMCMPYVYAGQMQIPARMVLGVLMYRVGLVLSLSRAVQTPNRRAGTYTDTS